MLAKADRVDNGEKLIGSYIFIKNKTGYESDVNQIVDKDGYVFSIKPETLKYSFDDEKTWYSEEDITVGLDLLHRMRR